MTDQQRQVTKDLLSKAIEMIDEMKRLKDTIQTFATGLGAILPGTTTFNVQNKIVTVRHNPHAANPRNRWSIIIEDDIQTL